VRESAAQLGYHVALNRPYAGGFITEHYGRPRAGIHALQLELNRALYLHEATLRRTSNFRRLQGDLATLARRLFEGLPNILERREAAE
jgi:N-formylglutamate amidohydrolase